MSGKGTNRKFDPKDKFRKRKRRADARKRRQEIDKRRKANELKPPTMSTTTYIHQRDGAKMTDCGICGDLFAELREKFIVDWKQPILDRVRIVTMIEYAPNCLPDSSRMKLPPTGCMKFNPQHVRMIEFRIVYLQGPDNNPREVHLFTVKKSELGEDAGWGLFAARNYKKNELLGVFYGVVAPYDCSNVSRYACTCTYYADEDGEYKHVIDPVGGVNSDKPAYFALHMMNDPTWGMTPDTPGFAKRKKKANVTVDHNLGAYAEKKINCGDELLFYYAWGERTDNDDSDDEHDDDDDDDNNKKDGDYIPEKDDDEST